MEEAGNQLETGRNSGKDNRNWLEENQGRVTEINWILEIGTAGKIVTSEVI